MCNAAPQRSVRTDLKLHGWLTDSDGGQIDVIVRDLSPGGCRLDADGSLEQGEVVTLVVGKSAPVRGVVRWLMLEQVGLEFL
ncbi:PilZ domain-containing protein [Sphingomicrobium sp. XHP0235]|uniref:PilZ domain-containing protein n=1 Tax=Sphingomicrobium aquimarinum TaxID=3133971 RepID=UPI0031FE6C37